MSKGVCVIGGGISGLCVALHLSQAGFKVTLYEKSSTVGGNIKTEIHDGFLIEHGPNTTLTSCELLDLIDLLGIADQIAPPNPKAKLRYILRKGKLVALPSRILGLIVNKAFSAKAKLRLLKEPIIRATSPPGESVAAFFERRLGNEIVEYAVDPFISGIYAGDPHKLSIRHAFPRLFELERDFGSLLTGAILSGRDKSRSLPKGTPRSITFKGGMQTLTDALAGSLGGSIKLNSSISKVSRSDLPGFAVQNDMRVEVFNAVVVSTPGRSAAKLIESLDTDLAYQLSSIYYAPVSVVFTAFKVGDVPTDPNGFGFLIPGIEERKILGSLWTSSVFENRAPEGYHLFTTFIGGSRNPELANKPEDDLLNLAVEELTSILDIKGEPAFTYVKQWPRAIPQYVIGYESVIKAIEGFTNKNPGIFFCSNFYKGISVADCVKNSVVTSREITDFLRQ